MHQKSGGKNYCFIKYILSHQKKIIIFHYYFSLKFGGKKLEFFLSLNFPDCCGEYLFNLLTPLSDQVRISPYNINTISSRQVVRI